MKVRERYYIFCIDRKKWRIIQGDEEDYNEAFGRVNGFKNKCNEKICDELKWKNVGRNILEVSMGMIKIFQKEELKWMLVVKKCWKVKDKISKKNWNEYYGNIE